MNCTQCGKLLPEANSPFCPFCGGTQSGNVTNPTMNQESAGQHGSMQTVAEQLEAAQLEQPVAMGGFQPAAAGSGTAFDPTLPQQIEKKRLPAWAIALIAGGIALILAFCCCVAILAFSDEFWEGFEEGFSAAQQNAEVRIDPLDGAMEGNEALVGTWVFEDDDSWVTTFNEDGTGSHVQDWGFGTRFEWSTSGGDIMWNYPDHEELYTPFRIDGDVLSITMEDGTVFRYLRDQNVLMPRCKNRQKCIHNFCAAIHWIDGN